MYSNSKSEPNKESNPQRFIDGEELKYSLRSVEKYLNWVRNLYCNKWANTIMARLEQQKN